MYPMNFWFKIMFTKPVRFGKHFFVGQIANLSCRYHEHAIIKKKNYFLPQRRKDAEFKDASAFSNAEASCNVES